jgi:chemotaxis protein MotB
MLLAAAIISGSILYKKYLDTKDVILISEKKVVGLNQKVIQLNQETSALHNQIRKNAERLKELDSARERISELEETIRILKEDLAEEKKTKGATVTELQERLQDSQSHIRYLEEEIAREQQESQQLHGQLLDLKGEKASTETRMGQTKSTYEALISDLKQQIEEKEVTIKAFEEKISVTFVDRILFDFGKASISPEGKTILKKVGEILKNVRGRQIRVLGHTDNIPILPEYQHRFASNWELSAARAAAIVRDFEKKIGLDPRNLEAVGRSFYDPIASNETDKGRAQNRRVEIIIAPKIE